MTRTRVRAHASVERAAVLAVGITVGLVLYRRIMGEVARGNRRTARLGREMSEHLDEVCARVHNLGVRLGAYPGPTVDGPPDLATEAREAEDRADREERGEVDPLPGQRPRRGR